MLRGNSCGLEVVWNGWRQTCAHTQTPLALPLTRVKTRSAASAALPDVLSRSCGPCLRLSAARWLFLAVGQAESPLSENTFLLQVH